jgi:hypothetical protein
MAPRKKKISKEQYQSIIEEHYIVFKGPAPPDEWPVPYQQHFSVIRNIWANRYDDYKANENIDKTTRTAFKCRVNDLREKALSLRRDININEATWRASVETIIIERFEKDPVWLVDTLFNLPDSVLTYYLLVVVVEMRNTLQSMRRRILAEKVNNQMLNWKEKEH